jgi:hypothetical protein
MIKTMDPKMVSAISHAVHAAIQMVGIDGLRSTSMFPSSSREFAELKLAA